jgi:hypothetical protein
MRYFYGCIVKYDSSKTEYLKNTAYAAQKPLLYALCARKIMKTGLCSYLNKIK